MMQRGTLLFISCLISLGLVSGCIRLTGQAGYFNETPKERTEKVVGFDTAKVFDGKQAKGSVST